MEHLVDGYSLANDCTGGNKRAQVVNTFAKMFKNTFLLCHYGLLSLVVRKGIFFSIYNQIYNPIKGTKHEEVLILLRPLYIFLEFCG